MTRRQGLAAAFLVSLLLSGCATGGGRPLAPASGTDQLRVAKQRYEQHDYTEAVELLKATSSSRPARPTSTRRTSCSACATSAPGAPLATTEFQILSSRTPTGDVGQGGTVGVPDHVVLEADASRTLRPGDDAALDRAVRALPHALPRSSERGRDQAVPAHRARPARREGVPQRPALPQASSLGPGPLLLRPRAQRLPETRWAERSLAGQATALAALGRQEDARELLEHGMPALTDPEAKQKAEEALKKLPPAPGPVPAPAPSAGAAG